MISDSDDPDLENEWRNQLIRTSIAKSSLMKVRKTVGRHFLTKGKIWLIGEYIKKHNIDSVFINAELTAL